MVRTLKVYRTAIGFHDAYVAAPSQKAALEAWGSDKDLFARGAAELVTDPALAADALATPGQVVRRLRGSAAEQLAALPPAPAPRRKITPSTAAEPELKPTRRSRAAPVEPARPRPDREALDAAEAAIVAAERAQAAQRAELADREAALARERRALAAAQEQELARLRAARNEAEQAYGRAVAAWRQ